MHENSCIPTRKWKTIIHYPSAQLVHNKLAYLHFAANKMAVCK